MSVLVLGSINFDLVVRTSRLPAPGETVVGGQFYRAAGGKGANQAVAAARLCRERATLVAAVGDDEFGRTTLAALNAENLDTSNIRCLPNQATGIALILVDQRGENMISVASGANHLLTPGDVDALPEAAFRRNRVFLASLEVPLATIQRGLERAKQFGLRTLVNPAPAIDRLVEQLDFRLIDVLTPNAAEAAQLSGVAVADLPSAAAAARSLQAQGVAQVLVTLGSQGVLLLDTVATHFPARRVTAIDTTAAGDAFNGALAASLSEGYDLLAAARWATCAAALSVTREGAQPSLPSREEVDRFAASSPH